MKKTKKVVRKKKRTSAKTSKVTPRRSRKNNDRYGPLGYYMGNGIWDTGNGLISTGGGG